MGQKETTAFNLSWTLTKLNGEDQPTTSYYYCYRPDPLYFIFEIDDNSNFWVPCQLKMTLKRNWGSWPSQAEEVVLGPFLVPCADSYVKKDDVARAAEPVLQWLWRTDEPVARSSAPVRSSDPDYSDSSEDDFPDEPGSDTLAPEVATVKKTFVFPPSYSQSHKFVPVASYYDTGVYADYRYPFLSQTTVDLRVNGTYGSRFSFNALAKRHVDDKAVVPEVDTHSSSGTSSISLANCFEFFAQGETLDADNEWFCPKCRQFVQANKKIDIWSVPQVLMLHVKRFSGGGLAGHKIETQVEFPNELDLAPYAVGPRTPEDMICVLYAVSEHSGSLVAGHYTAHAIVASDETAEWYSFNASSCYPANPMSAHNSLAYVLFYQRKSSADILLRPPPVSTGTTQQRSGFDSTSSNGSLTAASTSDESSDDGNNDPKENSPAERSEVIPLDEADDESTSTLTSSSTSEAESNSDGNSDTANENDQPSRKEDGASDLDATAPPPNVTTSD
jgi:hypothetical protein